MAFLIEDDFFDLKRLKSNNQKAICFSNKDCLKALKNPNTPHQAVIKILKTARNFDCYEDALNPSKGEYPSLLKLRGENYE